MSTLALNSTLNLVYGAAPVVHFTNSTDATSGNPEGYDKLLHIMAGRFQGVLRPQDLVLYHEAVVKEQRALASYHREIDLSQLPDDHIIGLSGPLTHRLSDNFGDLGPEELGVIREITAPMRHARGRLLPYIASPGSTRVSKKLHLPQDAHARVGLRLNNKLYTKKAIERQNNRSRSITIAQPLGMSIPNANVASRIFRYLRGIARSDPRSDGRVWAKLNCSGGGAGVIGLRDESTLYSWLQLPHVQQAFLKKGITGGVHMDVGIKARSFDSSPSVGIFVGRTPAQDRILIGSYQLLINGKDWVGNVGPLSSQDRAKIQKILRPIFHFLRSQGGFGLCGIDFIVGEDGVFYLIEINFRITGAMAAGFIARERHAPAWIAANEIPVPWNTSLDIYAGHLRSRKILLGPDSPTAGVFVLNGLPALGYGNDHPVMQGGVLAGSRDEAVEYLNDAEIRQEREASQAVG